MNRSDSGLGHSLRHLKPKTKWSCQTHPLSVGQDHFVLTGLSRSWSSTLAKTHSLEKPPLSHLPKTYVVSKTISKTEGPGAKIKKKVAPGRIEPSTSYI